MEYTGDSLLPPFFWSICFPLLCGEGPENFNLKGVRGFQMVQNLRSIYNYYHEEVSRKSFFRKDR